MAVRGKFSVAPIKNRSAERRDGKNINRIRPPNSFHRITISISTSNLFAIRKQQSQILQQIIFVQPQFLPDPIRLQRGDCKPAPDQGFFPKRNPAPAKPARIVVKNPANRFGLVFAHAIKLIPLCTFTSEPSARKAKDGGRFKNPENILPYKPAVSQCNSAVCVSQICQRGCSTRYSIVEPSRCAA